jgi:hypothetical protein
MKTKMLYYILIATMLLSACQAGVVAAKSVTESPAAQDEEIQPAEIDAPELDSKPEGLSNQAQSGDNNAEPPEKEDPQSGDDHEKRMPPEAAIAACSALSVAEACEFTSPKGTETGLCETVLDLLACSPQRGRPEDMPDKDTPEKPATNEKSDDNPVQKPESNEGQAAYNIDQALSDRAQGMTIAFDALSFLTGNLAADSFFPPGKVADFWGFQYLRDNDPTEMGHNTDFLTSAALNMLAVLTPAQRTELISLAEGQVDDINEYGYMRFVLMDAFRRLLDGELPTGTTGLDEDAVTTYSAELYRLDGQISFERAQVMGRLISEFDETQRSFLDAMVGKGMLEWPDVDEPDELRGLDRDVKVAVMTYAGDMFSWYVGSIAADVYFCPERQGTYFGSFYMKDAPAVGNPGYSIGTNITGDYGEALLAALAPDQASLITDLVDIQRPYLYGIVDVREQVTVELRKFMFGGSADNMTVLDLMSQYGKLDGSIVYNFAVNFAKTNETLTPEQQAQLQALREELLGAMIYPESAYLYSHQIQLPAFPNTDFLFK